MADEEPQRCGDCGVKPQEMHLDGCDVARCAKTGIQRLQCEHHDCNTVWTGQSPGEAECVEFGWFVRWNNYKGWVPCGPDHPGRQVDLNRLMNPMGEARWDPQQQRWVKVRP